MKHNHSEDLQNKETAKDNLEAIKEELKEENEEACEEEKMKRLQEEKEEINSQFLRMTADFQNYKKRVEKEKSDIYTFANEKLILDMLPVVDNLQRAIKTYKDEGKDESFTQGIDMILKQLLEVFEKNGVKEIETMGKEFDPNFHHAVMQEECDGYESNMIIDVFQKGYTLNEKVIRPSMVKVAN
ncbi:nucleotide exchange factor GrpE [Inediibacterium massiliense]|uniref:nucleotide exchange factor GrpE n=1 Tax=Inediibacterium massiliense TaxID=1658111 RepID=UPI0006B47D88|nr:nucleotide exchange factor GrpE [Inediibacterium massiliense]